MACSWRSPIDSIAVAAVMLAVLAVGSVPSRALEPPPEDAPGSDALKAAPWVICEYVVVRLLLWSSNEKKFKEESETKSGRFVVLFDNEKRRAMLAGMKENDVSLAIKTDGREAHTSRVTPSPRYALLLEFRLGEAPLPQMAESAAILISHVRSDDGRFGAIYQRLSGTEDSLFGLHAVQVPLMCAAAAEDALKQQIEKARAEWLAQPAAAPSGNSVQ